MWVSGGIKLFVILSRCCACRGACSSSYPFCPYMLVWSIPVLYKLFWIENLQVDELCWDASNFGRYYVVGLWPKLNYVELMLNCCWCCRLMANVDLCWFMLSWCWVVVDVICLWLTLIYVELLFVVVVATFMLCRIHRISSWSGCFLSWSGLAKY